MFRDPIHDENFRRVVGTRRQGAVGEPPSAEARAAMTRMANYDTGAPKGVFRYRTHEEANADREAWTLARIRRERALEDTGPIRSLAIESKVIDAQVIRVLGLEGLLLTKEGMRDKDRADARILRQLLDKDET